MERVDLLETALDAVFGWRGADYGAPEQSFSIIQTLWQTYLFNLDKTRGTLNLTEADIANLLILLKVARTLQKPEHKDSWVDVAGYAACGWDVVNRKRKDDMRENSARIPRDEEE
jgi:hypothetical protein